MDTAKTLLKEFKIVLFIVYIALITLIHSGLSGMLPAILVYRGVPEGVVGAVFSLEKILVLLLSTTTIFLSIRIKEKTLLLMPLLLLFYTISMLIFISTENILLIAILAPVITGLYLTLSPFNKVMINILVDSEYLGFFTGILNSISSLFSAISIAIYGFLISILGLQKTMSYFLIFIVPTLVIQLSLVRTTLRSYRYTDINITNISSLRNMKLLFKDFILIINTLHALIDIGASIYLGVVLWDIVKDFKIIGLIFAAYYILQIFISPFIGSLSDRYRKPVELIGISLITSALSYFILFLGYIYTSILIMCLAVIPFAIVSILYIPNIQIYVKNLGSDTVLYFQAINITSSLAGIVSPIIVSTMITRIDIKVFLFIIAIYKIVLGVVTLIKQYRCLPS
jgi:hypothetical protein